MKRLTIHRRIFIRILAIVLFMTGTGFCKEAKAPPPWRIHSITFTGNTSFNRYELLNLVELKPLFMRRNPRFSTGKLAADRESIAQFYVNNGFLEASVRTSSIVRDTLKKRVDLTIAIEEGIQTRISGITYSGWTPDSIIFRSLRCRKGEVLKRVDILNDENILRNRRREEGYLSTTVNTHQSVDSILHEADLDFFIQSGSRVRVDTVILSGIKKLKPQVVKRELVFREGDTLTSKTIKKSERNLYRTNLINSVSIYYNEDEAIADSAKILRYPVRVDCREANFFKLKLGAGYGSEERFRGSVETSYSNLFRLGHQVSLKGNVSQRLQQIQTIYSTPWFLSIPLRFDGKLYYSRFSDTTTYEGEFQGINLSFEKPVFENCIVHFMSTFENVLWIRSEGLPEDFPVKNTQSFGTDIIYDTRNSIIDPDKGLYATARVDVAGLTAVNSNRFIKVTEDMRWYWKIGQLGFASGIKIGVARPWGGELEVPLQDQFYAGGSKSVRGYKDNCLRTSDDSLHHALSGTTMLTVNCLELRFPVYSYLTGAVFADAGYLGDSITADKIGTVLESVRWSVGPGLRLKTPLAILRVDLGYKINRHPWEKQTQWHFDIGQSF